MLLSERSGDMQDVQGVPTFSDFLVVNTMEMTSTVATDDTKSLETRSEGLLIPFIYLTVCLTGLPQMKCCRYVHLKSPTGKPLKSPAALTILFSLIFLGMTTMTKRKKRRSLFRERDGEWTPRHPATTLPFHPLPVQS